MNNKKYEIAVLIGRFQLHELHEAHEALIDSVIEKHNRVILFLGVSSAFGTKRNPMDFVTRKQMLDSKYGNKLSVILPLHDQRDDNVWSSILDKKIREVFPIGNVVLYGSRDSFIPHYKGSFDVCELEPKTYTSATEIRENVSQTAIPSSDFRAGMIYAVYNQYSICYSVVDVAILSKDKKKVLLGRKPNESNFRFVGGFMDVTDDNDESAAIREAKEETNLNISDLQYVCSTKVDDWRYKNDKDRKIMTRFFIGFVDNFDDAKPQDDIAEIKVFDVKELDKLELVKEHETLKNKLINYLNK